MRTVLGGGSYEPPVEPGDGGRGGWRPRGLPWIVLLGLLGVMVALGLLAELTDLVSLGDEAAKGPLAGGAAPLGGAPTATPTLEVETQQAEARETPTVAATPVQSGGGTMTPTVTPGLTATATAGPEIAVQPEWVVAIPVTIYDSRHSFSSFLVLDANMIESVREDREIWQGGESTSNPCAQFRCASSICSQALWRSTCGGGGCPSEKLFKTYRGGSHPHRHH